MTKRKQKSNSAVVGFWLVLGASEKYPLIVCPALIRDKAVEKIESVSIKKVWSVNIQIPIDANDNALKLMIPEIINISLEKDIREYGSLWDVQAVKAKCESLATQYIEQFRSTKQPNGN